MSKFVSFENQYEVERDEKNENVEENYFDKEFFWNRNQEVVETTEETRQRLEELEIRNVQLDGMLENYQEQVTEAVETMMEQYPELKGYIGSIRLKELPEGVYACAGPRMDENGFYSEVQLSKEFFTKRNLELQLVDSENENFRGERWFAGKGIDGIVKHEMAHLLHLHMISDEVGLETGDNDDDKFEALEKKYYYNAIAIDICNQARENLNIHPSKVAQELSVYGASDFGEFFAEAISEYETQKRPRPLSKEVYRLYQERKEEKGE